MSEDPFPSQRSPGQPPPLPVMEYDTPPRADHVTRRKYQAALVVGAVFAALLAGILFLKLARQSGSVRIVAAPATPAPLPPAPAVVAPSAAQTVSDTQQRWNEKRLNELLADSLPPGQIVYEEDPVAARRLFGQGVCNRQA